MPVAQLPKHIDEQLVLSAISVEKDVDGFHPLNMGRLCMKVSQQCKVLCILHVAMMIQ
jgi:5,10-methylene-tetrahydrofolate dehydrogenase/methenyl tetrahydrofolate cyclohydrolase